MPVGSGSAAGSGAAVVSGACVGSGAGVLGAAVGSEAPASPLSSSLPQAIATSDKPSNNASNFATVFLMVGSSWAPQTEPC